MDVYAHHKRRYTRRDLTAKVERAGLRPIRVTAFVSLLLPGLAIHRLLCRKRSIDPHALVEMLSVKGWDGLLEKVMRIETGLIARGWSPQAGGSLLVVAERPK